MTALAYFGPQLFKSLVGGGSQDLLITGLFGAEKFIMCSGYIFLVSEVWNRRPTFYVSAIIMALLFVIVTVVNKTTPAPSGGHATSSGIAQVALVFITNSVYQFSWGPLCWPYTNEVRVCTQEILLHLLTYLLQIFPSRIREIGSSVAVSTQWLFNFLFSLVTPYMVKSMGAYTFLFYAALDFIFALGTFLFVKETKGRSIEEMETVFHSNAAFDFEAARKQGAMETVEELETVRGQDKKLPDPEEFKTE